MNLNNNTILITGGTSGIGLELGKVLIQNNNKVILLGRNEKKLEALRKKGFETVRCNLGDRHDIENAVLQIQNSFPDLNVLFNNAGIQNNYLFTDTIIPLDKIESEININVTGQMVLTHLLLPVIVNKEKAFIINTTSGLGVFPKKDGLVYSASKAAFRNFTRGLRYALKNTGIQVIEFIPPVTDTNMTSGREEKKMQTSDLIKKILPQLKKEKSIVTVRSIRLFIWISFLFPNLAEKILSKK